ncbi:MAG: SDR family NAD(P)-dependent oxidoreductase [Isosphaeraceae bacterium]
MDELNGKVALVTGGSRGIGRATAVALARAGGDVRLTFRTRGDEAAEAVKQVEALGRRAWSFQADLADDGQVARLVDEVSQTLGRVDVLVHNAGVSRPVALEDLDVGHFDEAVRVNLRPAFLLSQAFVAGMRERRWGRLVFVSSVAASVGGVVGPHYAASKAGMHGMAHAYASLLAREGVTSNVVAPALIDTEMVRANPRARPDLIPVGRFGTVEEVAEVVVAVASNGYITGQTIHVNGGWYFS